MGDPVFLSYNSADREAVMGVRIRLAELGVPVFLDRESLVPGLPWVDGLEEGLRRSRVVVVFVGPGGAGVWQRREISWALDRQAKDEVAGRRLPVIPVLLPGANLETASGFLMLGTWIDLREATGINRLVQALSPATAAVAPSDVAAICPYRGLQAFREEDAPLFFGRETFAQSLASKLALRKLVAVVGASGSGKSSVIQAGLLPIMRRRRAPDPTWDIVSFTPGKHPFSNLATALLGGWSYGSDPVDRLLRAGQLGDGLLRGTVKLEAVLSEASKVWGSADRLLVVVDQLEELFTLSVDAERRRFVDAVVELSETNHVAVAVTLRADFYGHAIQASRALSDAIEQGIVNLGPMKPEEMRRAIEEPARRVGLAFEPGLVDHMLEHVREQPGGLPLLEFALAELWKLRAGGRITNAAYEKIGKADGAVSTRAEEVYAALSDAQRAVALHALARLVHVAAGGEEGSDTRQRILLADLSADARWVMQQLAAARLVVMAGGPDAETVEVAHEALIRGWKRLREHLDSDRTFLLWRQRLASRLADWEQAQKDSGTLLRGALLDEALEWLKMRQADLSARERTFIRESARSQQRDRRSRNMVLGLAVGFPAAAIFLLAGLALRARTDRYQVQTAIETAPVVSLRLDSDSAIEPLARWTAALVLADHADEARSVVARVRESKARSAAVARMARALAALGRVHEAVDLLVPSLEGTGLANGDQLHAVAAIVDQAPTDDDLRRLWAALDITRTPELWATAAMHLVDRGRTAEVERRLGQRVGVSLADVESLLALASSWRTKNPMLAAKALEAARNITDMPGWFSDVRRTFPLWDRRLALALAEAGQVDQAAVYLKRSFAANLFVDPFSVHSTGRSTEAVLTALLRAQRHDQALALARETVQVLDRQSAEVAFLVAGLEDDAVALDHDPPHQLKHARVTCAERQAANHDWEAARRSIDKVLAMREAPPASVYLPGDGRQVVGAILAATHDDRWARELLAQSVGDVLFDYFAAQGDVATVMRYPAGAGYYEARAWMAKGDPDKALEIARTRLQDPGSRELGTLQYDDLLADLTEIFAGRDEPEKQGTAHDLIRTPDTRCTALLRATEKRTEKQSPYWTAKMLSDLTVKDPSCRSKGLAGLALWLVDHGRASEVGYIDQSDEYADDRSQVGAAMARWHARHGDLRAAMLAALQCLPEDRLNAFSEMLYAYAGARHPERAAVLKGFRDEK